MKQMQQIDGMSQNLMAHHIPLSSIPELQFKEPKQDSLIDKCLKGIIKERMSGCLINNERKGRALEARKMSMVYKGEKIFENRREAFEKYLNCGINTRYETPQKSLQKDENKTIVGRHISRRNSNLSNKEIISNRKQHNYSLNIAKFHKKLQSLNQDQPASNNNQSANQIQIAKLKSVEKESNQKIKSQRKNGEISFISAIEDANDNPEETIDQATSKHENQSSINSLFHLPKIRRNTRNLENKEKKVNVPGGLIKNLFKQGPEELINMDFWFMLTDPDFTTVVSKKKKRKNSVTNISDFNPSLLSSMAKQNKESKGSMFKPKFPNASKEQLLTYIDALPASLKILMKKFLYFFQVKLQNEISAIFYSQLIEKAKKINKRGWTAFGFIFWDSNRDGVITSDDIFQRFREFNEIEQQEGTQPQQDLKKVRSNEKKIEREKEDEDEEENDHSYGLKKIPTLPKKNEFTEQDEGVLTERLMVEQNSAQIAFDNCKSLVMKLESIEEAKYLMERTLQKLNNLTKKERISEEDKDHQEDEEVKYLEEVIITKPQLKYSDIEPLFSAGKNSQKKSEGHKRELFPEDLKVQCSSSYRQCFIATEHNEQTRMTREKIENYKLELVEMKKERMRRVNRQIEAQLQVKKFLTYEDFMSMEIGEKIKRIILILLGSKEK